MISYKLKDFTKGWFIGNFSPTLLDTEEFEVAIKKYSKGEYEATHFHKKAVEYTVVVSGRVKMKGIEYSEGDIIVIGKDESTDFVVIEDTVTCVVKTPSVKGDKFII